MQLGRTGGPQRLWTRSPCQDAGPHGGHRHGWDPPTMLTGGRRIRHPGRPADQDGQRCGARAATADPGAPATTPRLSGRRDPFVPDGRRRVFCGRTAPAQHPTGRGQAPPQVPTGRPTTRTARRVSRMPPRLSLRPTGPPPPRPTVSGGCTGSCRRRCRKSAPGGLS